MIAIGGGSRSTEVSLMQLYFAVWWSFQLCEAIEILPPFCKEEHLNSDMLLHVNKKHVDNQSTW